MAVDLTNADPADFIADPIRANHVLHLAVGQPCPRLGQFAVKQAGPYTEYPQPNNPNLVVTQNAIEYPEGSGRFVVESSLDSYRVSNEDYERLTGQKGVMQQGFTPETTREAYLAKQIAGAQKEASSVQGVPDGESLDQLIALRNEIKQMQEELLALKAAPPASRPVGRPKTVTQDANVQQ